MSKEQNDKVIQANNLKREISELEYFLTTVDPYKQVQRGSGTWDVNAILKKKINIFYSVFGSRWFGCGTHEQNIVVPPALIDDLYFKARSLKQLKEAQLSDLFK